MRVLRVAVLLESGWEEGPLLISLLISLLTPPGVQQCIYYLQEGNRQAGLELGLVMDTGVYTWTSCSREVPAHLDTFTSRGARQVGHAHGQMGV